MYAFRHIQYFDKNRLRNRATTCHTRKKKHAEKNAENIHHNVNLKPKTKSRKLN